MVRGQRRQKERPGTIKKFAVKSHLSHGKIVGSGHSAATKSVNNHIEVPGWEELHGGRREGCCGMWKKHGKKQCNERHTSTILSVWVIICSSSGGVRNQIKRPQYQNSSSSLKSPD